MIDEKIVFVLGAGASMPYGFPSGEQLRHDILLNFDKRVLSKIQDPQKKTIGNDFLKDFDKFGLDIDSFITYREQDYSEIGKVAIISSILNYEKNSLKWLFESEYIKAFKGQISKQTSYEPFKSDWYSYINKGMPRKTDILENLDDIDIPFTFITFNYDRSFEHYLFDSFSASYISSEDKKSNEKFQLKKQQIAKLINKIGIHHIYGSVGKLEWEEDSKFSLAKYAEIPTTYNELVHLSKNINIMHTGERIKDYKLIYDLFIKSEYVYFMGFGYDEENLRNLDIPQEIYNKFNNIYGTTISMSNEEIYKLRRKLYVVSRGAYDPKGNAENFKENCSCLELLRNHIDVNFSFTYHDKRVYDEGYRF